MVGGVTWHVKLTVWVTGSGKRHAQDIIVRGGHALRYVKRTLAPFAFLLDFRVLRAGRVIVRDRCLHSWKRTHP
jgi:hypothetical protein